MLDKEGEQIDAVTVVHAPTTCTARRRCGRWSAGKHVYCQKPLTRTVWEAQQLEQAAEKYKVATQMGNQGYSQRRRARRRRRLSGAATSAT